MFVSRALRGGSPDVWRLFASCCSTKVYQLRQVTIVLPKDDPLRGQPMVRPRDSYRRGRMRLLARDASNCRVNQVGVLSSEPNRRRGQQRPVFVFLPGPRAARRFLTPEALLQEAAIWSRDGWCYARPIYRRSSCRRSFEGRMLLRYRWSCRSSYARYR